ncbi:MAG: endolytic transglycosylase MltG [Candidatus Marinimicrobia bacterium]|nr:endolytic transglycosylase MltG [Candidatus Neomarinimicrobiota bacterium]
MILFWPQIQNGNIIKYKINKGKVLKNISHDLVEKGILENEQTFLLAVKLLGYEKDIQAGVFQLRDTSNNLAIINQLVNGTPDMMRIMIPEGTHLKGIAQVMAKKLGFTENEFLKLSVNKRFIEKLGINSESLEGYLLPDTYLFFDGDSPETVIKTMVKEYHSFWTQKMKNRLNDIQMSERDIVTLASIIEGEAIYNKERPVISGVYHNRLNIGMKLQADPTIQYIISDGPRRLLNRDLKIKSPYNTYLNKGLPPGPINSPGRESLEAALFPDEHNYLFFVAKGDGLHTFTINEKEHLKAKRAFQKIRREARRKKKI